jgi:flavin-binding protein dodecin
MSRTSRIWKETRMAGNVYKLIDLTGTSSTSIEDAVQTAIAQAARTVRNMSWFEITETRGAIKNDKVSEWQVTLRVGFRIEG